MNNQLSAASLLSGSKEYFHAMKILSSHLSNKTVRPIGLMASQSIELILKSYLVINGWDEPRLKKEIGHDLEKAWKEARGCGMPIKSSPSMSVRLLNISYDKPFLFRYPREKMAAAITSPEVLCREVEEMIGCVEKRIQSDKYGT